MGHLTGRPHCFSYYWWRHVAHLHAKCFCVSVTKLSLFIIFFTVTYVKQQYMKVILRFGENKASANLPQHCVPRTGFVPSYIYETKPEI
jgi:hypothetical protein